VDAALQRNPHDRELLYTGAYYRVETGDTAGALRLAQRLLALDPDNPQVAQMVRALEPMAR
jgi:Flp pilus assembly protein TadD